MGSIGLRNVSAVLVTALALAIATGSSAADAPAVQFDARVSWIAAETMVVSTEDGSAVSVDLSAVPQDEYQRLATGDRVVVSGTLAYSRVMATSIQSVE